MKKIVVYVPARMGSQRVPKKNIRLIGGKPLIAWAIEAAKQSEVFDDIYVKKSGKSGTTSLEWEIWDHISGIY